MVAPVTSETDQHLRIAMGQINLVVGDIAGNVTRLREAAADARDRLGAALVVFPELALTGYPPEDLLLRPEFIDRSEAALQQLRDSIRGIDVLVGHPSRGARGLHNTATLIGDGEIVASYHKQLLPNYSVFDEKRYFVAGDSSCVVERYGIRLGITICEDIWEPQPAAAAVDAGAMLLLNINASPFHLEKGRQRDRVLAERVAETGVPVIYVNLVGGQDELVFDGGSRATGGPGQASVRAPFFTEGVYAVDIVVDRNTVRCGPGLQADMPDEAQRIYQALTLGVRDYVTKNHFEGVVLGLSGGIDSALTLAIAVDAMGADKVEAVLMPSRYTADMSNEDARQQCETMGVTHYSLPIEPAFVTFLDMLAPVFGDRPADTTEENIQARCRGLLLMAISNKSGRLVLSTSNKSETAVGYSTLYGDMAGGFAPIKDVPKTLVYRLAQYRNRDGIVIPQRVMERPPSAELRPEQTDQDSLPPYEILDPILHLFVERDCSIDEIVARGYARQEVERIARLVIVNEYKRRQAAPGVRITPRAFGRDRRYPITSGFRG